MMDWQTPVAVGLGLLAAAHLGKRWWPTWKGLLRPPIAASAAQGGPACSDTSKVNACGSGGCGSCASSAPTPSKDHRIQVVRKPRA